MGGENDKWSGDTKAWLGSSPRGRGKRGEDCLPRARLRLIPARAGKTRGAVNDALAPATHPRAGGENLTPAGRLVIDGGSSPRGRGKHRAGARVREHPGLIPARAGKTSIGRATSRVLPGSSPRGRGKHSWCQWQDSEGGLIPARAGKTACADPTARLSTAHPRAGGENVAGSIAREAPAGSSPRGRGKPLLTLAHHSPVRLIPARAGKTRRRRS